MRKNKGQQDSTTHATQTVLENLEIAVSQSANERELSEALGLLQLDSWSSKSSLELYQLAGPAKLIGLVLAGFEMPSVATRHVSAIHLSKLIQLLQARRSEPLSEQVALILAQQREVLLETIEQDLEALYNAEGGVSVEVKVKVFALLHKQLRDFAKSESLVSPKVEVWQQLTAFGALS
mgnify:CR=1 FL=1